MLVEVPSLHFRKCTGDVQMQKLTTKPCPTRFFAPIMWGMSRTPGSWEYRQLTRRRDKGPTDLFLRIREAGQQGLSELTLPYTSIMIAHVNHGNRSSHIDIELISKFQCNGQRLSRCSSHSMITKAFLARSRKEQAGIPDISDSSCATVPPIRISSDNKSSHQIQDTRHTY